MGLLTKTLSNAGNTSAVDWIDRLERHYKLLSAAKLCREWDRTREPVYSYLKKHPGAFGAVKIDNLWFIPPSSVEAFKERFA